MRRVLPALMLLLAVHPQAKAIVRNEAKVPLKQLVKSKSKSKKKEKGEAADFPYMDNVGMVGMGSGIYLGDGYVLTSTHVGCFPFVMGDGSHYEPIYNTWHVLENADGTRSDLAIFKVNTGGPQSSLSKLTKVAIGNVNDDLGTDPDEITPMVMIGTGFIQKDVPTTMTGTDLVLGYNIQAKREKRCGINTVAQILNQPVNTGTNLRTSCFTTKFQSGEGEAQAADGDSGGAMFAYNASLDRWELVGCIIAVSQKGAAVPYGCKTFLGNLASYRAQIPASLGMEERRLARTVEEPGRLVAARSHG